MSAIATLYAVRRSLERRAVRRCDAGVRHAARRSRPAGRARAPHRVRDGVERDRRIGGLPAARALALHAPSRRSAPAGRGVPGARPRVRDARRAACARCAPHVGDMGARRRGAGLGRRAAATSRPARVRIAAAGRRGHRVRARIVASGHTGWSRGGVARSEQRLPRRAAGRGAAARQRARPRACACDHGDRAHCSCRSCSAGAFCGGSAPGGARSSASSQSMRASRRSSPSSPASAVMFAAVARRLALAACARAGARCWRLHCCVIALYRVGELMPVGGHLFAAWGFIAWPFALPRCSCCCCGTSIARRRRTRDAVIDVAHAAASPGSRR